MRTVLGSSFATIASMFIPITAAYAGCPPGYREIAHWVQGEGDNQTDFWKCVWGGERAAKTALQQLQRMGEGYVDTTTGFDGGQGMSAAVAQSPVGTPSKIDFGSITTEDLRSFAKDEAYSNAVATLDLAKEDLTKAQAKMADLRSQQAKAKTPLEKQKIQIAISDASIELNNAKGAERIASNNVVKEVIRLKPQVMSNPAAKKDKKATQ